MLKSMSVVYKFLTEAKCTVGFIMPYMTAIYEYKTFMLCNFFKLVELKNGETYNGHLVSCDNWMNINLREVICTSRVSLTYFQYLLLGFIFGACYKTTSLL